MMLNFLSFFNTFSSDTKFLKSKKFLKYTTDVVSFYRINIFIDLEENNNFKSSQL